MGDREEVLAVILEHAIKHRQSTLVQVIQQQTMDSRLPDIFYVISFLDKVYTTKNVTQFDLAAKLIEAVYDADKRVSSFKSYSKLLLGLKMKVLLECLRSKEPDIEAKLNKNLPEKRKSDVGEMIGREFIDYQDSVTSFREFFIPLIKDREARDKYFLEEYEAEYGKECVNCLMKLLNSFILQIIGHLPTTKLELLFMQRYDQSTSGNKDLRALLDFLQGIMILTEEDLIRFLDVFHKDKTIIPDIENSKENSVDRKRHKENSVDGKEVKENSVDRNKTKDSSKGNSVDRKIHTENSLDRKGAKEKSIDRKGNKENSKRNSLDRKEAKENSIDSQGHEENSKENSVDRQRHKENSKENSVDRKEHGENSNENSDDNKEYEDNSKEISVDSSKSQSGKNVIVTSVIDFDPHNTIVTANEQKPKEVPNSKHAKKHEINLKNGKGKPMVQRFEETDQCSYTGHLNKDHCHEDLDDNENQRIDEEIGMCHLVIENKMKNKQIDSEGLNKRDFGRSRSKIIDGDKETCCIDSNGNIDSVGKCMFKGVDNASLDINQNTFNKYGNSKMINACSDKANSDWICLNKNNKEHDTKQPKMHKYHVTESLDTSRNTSTGLDQFENLNSSVNMYYASQIPVYSDRIKDSNGKYLSSNHIEKDGIHDRLTASSDKEENLLLGKLSENIFPSIIKSKKLNYYTNSKRNGKADNINDKVKIQITDENGNLEASAVDRNMEAEKIMTDMKKQLELERKRYESRTPKKNISEMENVEHVSPIIKEIKMKGIYEKKKTDTKMEDPHIDQKQTTGKRFSAKRKINYIDLEEDQIMKKLVHLGETPNPVNSKSFPVDSNLAVDHLQQVNSDMQTLSSEQTMMLSQVNTDIHGQAVRIVDDDLDSEEFPVIPPSSKDSESDIEVQVGKDQEKAQSEKDSHSKNRGGKKNQTNSQLEDLADEVCFKDAQQSGATLPSLDRFRITSPVKLCIVKLFEKKGGIFS